MATLLGLLIMGLSAANILASLCQPELPPLNGLLNCVKDGGMLVCHATCKEWFVFPNMEKTQISTCDLNTGQWQGSNRIEDCRVSADCSSSLLSGGTANLTASSVYLHRDEFTAEMARFSHKTRIWKPDKDDLEQYIQASFRRAYRFTGVITKGDGGNSHVRRYRLLFSMDGITWSPYTDNTTVDKFFRGNSDSTSEQTETFTCTYVAKHVRLNPIAWNQHITTHLDLLGCPYRKDTGSNTVQKPTEGKCKPLSPPNHGSTTCEIREEQVVCTFTCQKGYVFSTTKEEHPAALTRSCDVATGLYSDGEIPQCIEKPPALTTHTNTSGFCLEGTVDCDSLENGDYQFCGDCHYFATCAEHVFYVRECAAKLKFDSRARLCDYRSSTCGMKSRREVLYEQRKHG